MKKNFLNSVKLSKPNKNVFDLSHDVKLSCNMGQLVPTMCEEAVPGDKFNISCESLLRFAPLIAPVMHRVDVSMHYFFVPYRLLWPNWEKFITNTKEGGVLPAFPTYLVDDGGANYTKLMDYLGVPPPGANPGADTSEYVSAMPFAAYQKIYNDYYRDQNLIPEGDLWDGTLLDGANTAENGLSTLRYRAWEHDYFTAALPFAQKGDAVNLPIGEFGDVPVKRNQVDTGGTVLDGTPDDINVQYDPTTDPAVDSGELYAQTSGVELQATTINDLRTAFRLQEWLEKAARGGSRYVELILNFFGVRSQDSRLQRAEYITGTKSPVVISEVLQTSSTDVESPQGNMAGHGISVTNGQYGGYYVQEHGVIMGIMSIIPKTAYQQGISRMWKKILDPTQYFWPQFANLGEQEILNSEVFAYTNTGDETFGYIPRYGEYKFANNRVAGDFRTTQAFWHFGRIFDNPPVLNDEFVSTGISGAAGGIRYDPFAVEDPNVDHMWCHVYHKIKAVRPMPKYGTPTF